MTILLWTITAMVAILVAHTAANVRLLRRPSRPPSIVDVAVSVLVPVRNEAQRIRPCLESLLHQVGVPDLDIVVLDDQSTDDTAAVVRDAIGSDNRARLVRGGTPPPGWLGKPYACHQLAMAAHTGSPVLVFVDADVVLAPDAIAAAVALLKGTPNRPRWPEFDLVSPYPRIITRGCGQRLVQPLLHWSWLTTLPLRAMERSRRPSLAAAGGQFLVFTRAGYEAAGGHRAVANAVLEDVELARAVKRAGGRISVADGSEIATCRMYDSWRDLVNGYSKSLWSSFGSAAGSLAVVSSLLLLYVFPPIFAIAAASFGRWSWALAGLCAYLLAVLGRVLTAAATGCRVWPDALGHPLSIVLFGWLVARSHRHHHRGDLSWKDRPLR